MYFWTLISKMMDYSKLSYKDFESIPDQNIMERAGSLNTYLNYLDDRGYLSYHHSNYL